MARTPSRAIKNFSFVSFETNEIVAIYVSGFVGFSKFALERVSGQAPNMRVKVIKMRVKREIATSRSTLLAKTSRMKEESPPSPSLR
jgi:hypothetical protein